MRSFPADLAQAQQEWSATYRQLGQQRRPSPAAWWELRDLERSDADVLERLHR
jgi:hypothetical protein